MTTLSRTSLLQKANSLIDKFFPGHHGISELQLKAELHEAVNEVFKKVADWFQVPQTGFISATGKELCEIIRIDLNCHDTLNFFGNAVDEKYTGISVHRLYDCLAVLLQNAVKHGERNSPIRVEMTSRRAAGTAFDLVTVRIGTKVADAQYESSMMRISSAIAVAEDGVDMVTEGYSGIKKVKFITRTCEGSHTVAFTANDSTKVLELSFCMHAETAHMDAGVSGR